MLPFHLCVLHATLLAIQVPAGSWRLSDTPKLVIGGANAAGPTELANVYAGTFWAGRLAILDGGSQTIRLFDQQSGRHLQTIGRKGQGPGEYVNAAYLQPFAGDSLFVADIQLSRFTILDSLGRWERTVSVAALVRDTRLTPLGRFADGSVLGWAPRFTEVKGPGLQRLPATIFRIDAAGTQADSIARLPFATVLAMDVGGAQGWRAALGAGQMQPAITGTAAYLNSPTQFLVHVYTPSTGQWSTISAPNRPMLGSDELAKAMRADAVEHGALPQLMSRVAIVDTLPAIRYPLVTPTGRLWLLDGVADSVAHRRGMTAYERDGRFSGRLSIPAAYAPLAVNDSLILFTDRDAEGSVVYLYGLIPPGR